MTKFSEWQPIETAPDDVAHFRGLWVNNNQTGVTRFDYHFGLITDEGEFVDPYTDDDFGWRTEDFTHWHPALQPPKESK